MARSYYDVLGVSKDATEAEIKKAFRKLSKELHPDAQHGKSDAEKKEAEEKFKEASEAYETLSNKDKRTQYDMQQNRPSGFGGFSNAADMFSRMRSHFGPFGGFDPFDGMGGMPERPNPNGPEDGNDVQIQLNVSFKESLFGVVKEFDLQVDDVCDHCHGTGTSDGKPLQTCSACGGSGMFVHQQGPMIIQQTCHNCGGSGYMNSNPCPRCYGSRRTKKSKHMSLRIPAGIDNGNRLRIAGGGQCGINGGHPGDLYVQIHVPQSDVFKRSRNDLETVAYISLILASIGGKLEVYSPFGSVQIKIPAGTKSGQKFRVAGKGVKTAIGTGDLYVVVELEPLVNLSAEQKKMLESFNATVSAKNLQKSEELRKKLEDLFK